jgi:hypothetical protein
MFRRKRKASNFNAERDSCPIDFHLLYGVRPIDLAVFLAVPLILMLVALLASYIPARRAARVNPVVALRES